MTPDIDPAGARATRASLSEPDAATSRPMPEPRRARDGADRLVVIGASAGGVEALQRVVNRLPGTFPAPVVVVLHMSPSADSRLTEILERAGSLPARTVVDGMTLRPGVIHVAPPDRHVICVDHELRLVDGPRENGVRPAIDPLFRSAARTFREGAIAVVLSGTLDDGTAGVAAVHAAGGITLVQAPDDAIAPGMPSSAIENAHADHVAPAGELAELLTRLVGEPVPALARDRGAPSERSVATDFVCPECGGVLRRFEEDGVVRFHCRVGHNYSGEALSSAQDARLEAALWAAIRSLEESASLARRLANDARQRGAVSTAQRFDARELEAAQRADLIRSAILELSDLDDTPPIGEAEPVASEDDAARPDARDRVSPEREVRAGTTR
jgi:two-component system chemotaxis response regulator CheB